MVYATELAIQKIASKIDLDGPMLNDTDGWADAIAPYLHTFPDGSVSGVNPGWADLIARLERIEAKLDKLLVEHS
jgi:hypothetical protein